MDFATELLTELRLAWRRWPLPRVRAVHLPPPEAGESRSGEFCAVELDDGALGLSYVLLDGAIDRLNAASAALSRLAGTDALALAQGFAGEQLAGVDGDLSRTLGFAAANALSRSLMDRIGFQPPRAADSIAGINPQPGDHVGMIGLFTPLLKQVTAAGAQLTVIELRAEWAGEFDGYRVSTDPAALQQCNKVLTTSTILLNHSVDRMLAHCRNARHIGLIGPGAGCLPRLLFARGVTVLGGSWITDRKGFIDALRQGESWSRFAFKFAMRAADWPGLPEPC